MEADKYIALTEICTSYRIDNSFLYSLREFGLVKIVALENKEYLPLEQLNELERIVRLHYDLEINLEGIDVIYNLLERVQELQRENQSLRNRLTRWE